MEIKSRAQTEGTSRDVLPGDSSHIQLPNPDTIVDAKKYMLKGA